MRVGDVPQVTISRGRTRIYLEGANIWGPRYPPKDEPKDKNHVVDGVVYGVVYANPAAHRALKVWGTPKFPPGSVIVRETLANPGDAKPVLLVAMVKRAPGFNPKGGDWEFLSIEPSLKKIKGRQKKGSCLDCHSSQQERDFIFSPRERALTATRLSF